MVKKILIGIGVLVLAALIFVAYTLLTTKRHSPEDLVSYVDDDERKIEIVYCQPSKKDRLIFGKEEDGALVPWGKKWRTGANEATEIEFSQDVMVYKDKVPAGRYSVYTIPDEKVWTVVLNSKTDYWGVGFNDVFEEEKDVVRVKVPAIPMESTVEMFTMKLKPAHNDIEWQMMWDKTMVMVPVKFL
jgi:hypothetical protein